MSTPTLSPVETGPPRTVSAAVFKDIVCGVDGSRGSYLAAHQAASLSGADGAIRFVAIHHTQGVGLNEVSTLSERRALEALEDAERMARGKELEASYSLIPGTRVSEALRAEAAGRDLLVIGSQGGSRAGGIMLGRTVTQMAHRCEQPLLISRRTVDHHGFPESVLLATDGSDGSWAAARVVAHLAAHRKVEVHVVYVPEDGGLDADRQVWEQLMLIAGAAGRPPGFQDSRGAVPERICQAARARQSSLLVIGRRGLSGVRALGSVSERVAHRASCSVLLVPPTFEAMAAKRARSA